MQGDYGIEQFALLAIGGLRPMAHYSFICTSGIPILPHFQRYNLHQGCRLPPPLGSSPQSPGSNPTRLPTTHLLHRPSPPAKPLRRYFVKVRTQGRGLRLPRPNGLLRPDRWNGCARRPSMAVRFPWRAKKNFVPAGTAAWYICPSFSHRGRRSMRPAAEQAPHPRRPATAEPPPPFPRRVCPDPSPPVARPVE